MKNIVKVLTVVLLSQLIISASVLKVPTDYSTIQSAIDASSDGDTVLVSDGTYFENIRFFGKGILVGSEFVIDGDVNHIVNTIIDGSQPTKPDSASCVLFIDGEDSTSIIEGFTITGGTGTLWKDEHGAGNYYEGGGILTALSAPVIKHNIITGNDAIRKSSNSVSAGGGGIRAGDGNAKIIGNIISNNRAMYGGGITMNYTHGLIQNNIIEKNTVYQAKATAPTFGGGGVWINGTTDVDVINNTIVGNSSDGGGSGAAGRGGGVLVWNGNATLTNNIVWGNIQSRDKQIKILNNVIPVKYNNVEDGFNGEGNISLDPIFELHNYILSDASPSIDAGDPSQEYFDPTDGANAIFPSLGGERNDMGAYGGPLRFQFPDNIVSVDGPSSEELNYNFNLEQNYPNPFNPSTEIVFNLPKAGEAKIKVYNMLGRETANIDLPNSNAGTNSINFDARNLSAGVYFYQLNFEGNVRTKKMMLLK